jgi:Fe2+ or Zn2+ uptake regulation protein
MAQYAETVLTLLQAKGFRITKPRRLVVELLEEADRALSPYEMKDLLEAKAEKVDTVTIYRILECLEEHHLVHKVLGTGKVQKCQLPNEAQCTLHQADHCHHLLLCDSCGQSQEIHCPGISELVHQVEAISGFNIHTHHIEFKGLCPNCQ